MLCHFAHYGLFSKVDTLFCSTASTTFFEWSRSIVSSVSCETKEFANEVYSWTHIKHAKTYFFCCKVEVCCERAITFSIKVIWRVTIAPSQRNFNKALSRATVVIGQAFGMLKGGHGAVS